MKKLLIFITLSFAFLMSLNFFSPVVLAETEDNVAESFYQAVKQVKTEWADTKLIRGEKLYDATKNECGIIYRVYQQQVQKGYIIYTYKDGVIEAKFQGEDIAKNIPGKVYYIFPSLFVDKNQLDAYLNEEINVVTSEYVGGEGVYYSAFWHLFLSKTFTIDTNHVPDLSRNFDSYSSSMSGSYWINETPDYLEAPHAVNCLPIASAMMLGYYDNELWDDLSNLEDVSGNTMFPLLNEDNQPVVDNFVNTLASSTYENCDDVNGTTFTDGMKGLTVYMDNHNHGNYYPVYAPINDLDKDGNLNLNTPNYFNEYTTLITLGNPSILIINQPGFLFTHAVLGTGFYNVYHQQPGFIMHDEMDHGDTWISQTNILYYVFLYH